MDLKREREKESEIKRGQDNMVRFMLLSSIGIKCKNIVVDLSFDC